MPIHGTADSRSFRRVEVSATRTRKEQFLLADTKICDSDGVGRTQIFVIDFTLRRDFHARE